MIFALTPPFVKPIALTFPFMGITAPAPVVALVAAPIVVETHADDESWVFSDEAADEMAELAAMDAALDFACEHGHWSC